MKVRWGSRAAADARAARIAYQDRAPETVDEFSARLDKAVALLSEFPEAGRQIHGGYRSLALEPYPYRMIYRTRGQVLQVVAVAHSRQRSGYWRDR